jgi:hypothetical protein
MKKADVTMRLLDLFASALGVATVICAHMFPDASNVLYTVGGALAASGLPQLSTALSRKDS